MGVSANSSAAKAERGIIIELRKSNPSLGAKTLARKISSGVDGFSGASSRPFLSTYSVIRRYDAKVKAAAVAVSTAKAVKKAGKRIAESVI
jgi:hypothetical protein